MDIRTMARLSAFLEKNRISHTVPKPGEQITVSLDLMNSIRIAVYAYHAGLITEIPDLLAKGGEDQDFSREIKKFGVKNFYELVQAYIFPRLIKAAVGENYPGRIRIIRESQPLGSEALARDAPEREKATRERRARKFGFESKAIHLVHE